METTTALKKNFLIKRTMSLTLVISSLSGGGAERVLTILANYWAEKGVEINLLTFDDGSESPFYPLHPAVNHQTLNVFGETTGLWGQLSGNIKRILVLRAALKKSRGEAIISFMTGTNITTLIAGIRLRIPVIVCERVEPSFSIPKNIWWVLRKLTYPMADKVTVLTQSAVAFFSPAIQRKISVIPNPVLAPPPNGTCKKEHTKKTLLAMGRLEEQKGFDLLLRAMAEISPKFPDWTLDIWGQGQLLESLQELRDQLGLQHKVQFPGITKNPYEVMKKADLFVMSSRFEGFPNALAEAMACGMPVISFGCDGPRDIIRDGIDGLLVPPEDAQALSAALGQLMGDKEKCKRLSSRAPEVIERYGLNKVMAEWESLIEEVAS
jgi:GalNAc-alpha-(1->4)-GalNAc-alpha-(1->3)-diNAcBac-PP-undecaprenol alpha-1,4-N-acetyl-D-galactosaminyltransferase